MAIFWRKKINNLVVTTLLVGLCPLILAPQSAVAAPTTYDASTAGDWNSAILDSATGNPAPSFNFLKNQVMWKTWGTTGADFEGTTITFDVSFSDNTDYISLFWGTGPGNTANGSTNDLYIGPSGNLTSGTALSQNLGLTTNHAHVDGYWPGISGGITGTGAAGVTGGDWLLNTWYTVKLEINKSSSSYYVNDVLIQSISTTLPADNEISIGGDDRNGWPFSGGVSIDNISISQSPLISYDLNYAGAPSAPTQDPVAQGSTFEVAANPSRIGYQFMGWTDNGANNGAVYGVLTYRTRTTYTVGASNIVLTANWESLSHPIVRTMFNNNNVASDHVWSYFGGSLHSGIDIVPGWCAVDGNNADPAKNAHSSWVVSSVTRDTDTETIFSMGNVFASGTAYQFSPDPSITFSAGGTQTVTAGTAITSTATSNSGCGANKYTISPALPANLSLDSSTGVISGTPATGQSSSVYTLTAERWVDSAGALDVAGTKIGYSSATFTLQVDTPHGIVPTIVDLTVASATSTLSPNFTLGTSTGTTSAGATASNNGKIASQSLTGDQFYGTTIDYTTYAYVSLTHTVTYFLDGGKYENSRFIPTQLPQASGVSFKLATSKELSKVGYTFNGWFDGTRIVSASVTYTMGNSDLILTASWLPKTFKVTWDKNTNGGKSGGVGGASMYTVGQNITTLPTDAVKPGKVFRGWFSARTGGTRITASYLALSPFGNLTFYAQFS